MQLPGVARVTWVIVIFAYSSDAKEGHLLWTVRLHQRLLLNHPSDSSSWRKLQPQWKYRVDLGAPQQHDWEGLHYEWLAGKRINESDGRWSKIVVCVIEENTCHHGGRFQMEGSGDQQDGRKFRLRKKPPTPTVNGSQTAELGYFPIELAPRNGEICRLRNHLPANPSLEIKEQLGVGFEAERFDRPSDIEKRAACIAKLPVLWGLAEIAGEL
jgi:hypothetical protein